MKESINKIEWFCLYHRFEKVGCICPLILALKLKFARSDDPSVKCHELKGLYRRKKKIRCFFINFSKETNLCNLLKESQIEEIRLIHKSYIFLFVCD